MCVCVHMCAGVTGRWERNQACSALMFGIFTTPSRGHEGKNLITANPARMQVAAETAALFWLLTKAEQVYVFSDCCGRVLSPSCAGPTPWLTPARCPPSSSPSFSSSMAASGELIVNTHTHHRRSQNNSPTHARTHSF